MAQATFIQDGNSIDHTPSSAVAVGDVVVQGSLVGVAKRAIAAAALGALAVAGVFSLVKATGAVTVGQQVYWDADGNPVGGTAGSGAATTTATANTLCGKCVKAAASADTTVSVRFNQ